MMLSEHINIKKRLLGWFTGPEDSTNLWVLAQYTIPYGMKFSIFML